MDAELLKLIKEKNPTAPNRKMGEGITPSEYSASEGVDHSQACKVLKELETMGILTSQYMKWCGKRVHVYTKAKNQKSP